MALTTSKNGQMSSLGGSKSRIFSAIVLSLTL